MNQQGINITIPFSHGMVGLFIPWVGLGIVVLIAAFLVGVSIGVVYLMSPRRREPR